MSGTAEPEDDEPFQVDDQPARVEEPVRAFEESGTPSAKKMVTAFEDLDEVRAVRRRGQTRAHPAARTLPSRARDPKRYDDEGAPAEPSSPHAHLPRPSVPPDGQRDLRQGHDAERHGERDGRVRRRRSSRRRGRRALARQARRREVLPLSPRGDVSRARDGVAKRSSWLPEGVVRNLAILWGACLGAAYEVTRIPTTVQNFNKAVYATTGYLGEYLPRGYDRALGAVDYYAMVADVVSALAFFVLNIVVAIAMVMVTVRVITLFTGYGESALNSVCIRSRGPPPSRRCVTSPPVSSGTSPPRTRTPSRSRVRSWWLRFSRRRRLC